MPLQRLSYFLESIAMGIGFGTQGILVNYNAGSVIIVVLTLTAGSAFLMWMGERMNASPI